MEGTLSAGKKLTVAMTHFTIPSSSPNPSGSMNPIIYLENTETPATKRMVMTLETYVASVAIDDWYTAGLGLYGDPSPPPMSPRLAMLDAGAVWTFTLTPRPLGHTIDVRVDSTTNPDRFWGGSTGSGGTGLCAPEMNVYLGWMPDWVGAWFDGLQGIQPMTPVGNGCVDAVYLSAAIENV